MFLFLPHSAIRHLYEINLPRSHVHVSMLTFKVEKLALILYLPQV